MLLKFFIVGIAMASAITGSFRIWFFFPGKKKLNRHLYFLKHDGLFFIFVLRR